MEVEERKHKEYLLVIPGRLPGLNEYISAERSNRYKGAKLKRESEDIVVLAIRKCLNGIKIRSPVRMEYVWYEKDKRRDCDNITFGRKVIQDALVNTEVLKDDGWKHVVGFSDRFEVDKENPRIEVLIKEIK